MLLMASIKYVYGIYRCFVIFGTYGDMSNSKLNLSGTISYRILYYPFFFITYTIFHKINVVLAFKIICELWKVPNWCYDFVVIMNQFDQNINKDMIDSDLIDVESLDFSDDQTWYVYKLIYFSSIFHTLYNWYKKSMSYHEQRSQTR